MRTATAGRAGGELPPGEKDLSCRSGIAASPAQVECVAQSGLVLGAAGAGNARRRRSTPGAGAKRRPRAGFPDDGVEAGERRAGEKGGFGFRFGRMTDRAQAGNGAGEATRRRSTTSDSARNHRKRYSDGGAFATGGAANRLACRPHSMSDKLALSDVPLFIVNHAPFYPADRRDQPPASCPNGLRAGRQAPPPAVDCASGGPLPSRLAPLAETARAYARAATSPNTNRAYAADWRHIPPGPGGKTSPPCPRIRKSSASTSPPAPPARPGRSLLGRRHRAAAVGADLEFRPAGEPFDRKDRHIATVLAGIRRTQGRPPEQKEAVLPEDLMAMIATFDLGDLRGLRDRAILLVGFAGGLRRSEIVGLDCRAEDGLGGGWIEFFDDGLLLTVRGKTGWREVEIGRGSSDATCPVVALQDLAEICADFGRAAVPAGRRRQGRRRAADRQARRPARQTNRAGRRRARRPFRGRAGEKILGPFVARRPRLLGRGRRALRAKAARPRLRRNDPALPAPPRPVPGQSDQGGGPVSTEIRPALPPALLGNGTPSKSMSSGGGRSGTESLKPRWSA